MFTKFNDNTIETKFIQNLLASSNIPTHTIWKQNQFVSEGATYLTQYGIYKALMTGISKTVSDLSDQRKFQKIADYEFGRKYFNYTTNYCSTSGYYDSETHYYLGQYLRAYRDIYGIDLMPFYNCYSGDYITDIDFDNGSLLTNTGANGYKIVAIPVKFNKTYSIYIDSGTPIQAMCAIYGEKGNIQDLSNILNNYNQFNEPIDQGVIDEQFTSKVYNNTSFRKPVLFTTPSWSLSSQIAYNKLLQKLVGYERYLKLLLKIPSSNKSSIVVIEGDMSKNPYRMDVLGNYQPTVCLGSQLISELSLTQISDGEQYAFSDRLIEFLIRNVITSQDDIVDNIKRVQGYITDVDIVYNNPSSTRQEGSEPLDRFMYPFTNGVWNQQMQKYLFDLTLYTNLLVQKYDITGFVDKDTEQLITRGQE